MAVLNVRIDDQARDQLRVLADQAGVTLSEYVRELVLAAVVPVAEERARGDQPPPTTLGLLDRQVLALLHRILGRVLPADANDVDGDLEYQLKRAEILEQGFTGEYWYETVGFSPELSKRDCDRVSDILQMFRMLTFSVDHLEQEGVDLPGELRRRLEFQGFDHNDSLEAHMASYVRHLTAPDEHYRELKPQIARHDGGNSHGPTLPMYTRMLTEYRRIVDRRQRGAFDMHGHRLSAAELERVAEARKHPSLRPEPES